jgi:hypothetical protein
MHHRRLRLALVGQATFFETCLPPASRALAPSFHEFRRNGDVARLLHELRAATPDVVCVFRPELIPAGALHGLDALTLGFLTEPLPRGSDPTHPVPHEDLARRLWELEQVDRTNFDRIVAFDPFIAPAASGALDVWRSIPLPVGDRYFRDVGEPFRGRPRLLFVGRSTPHRERVLMDVKHHNDLLHLAFGVGAAELEQAMSEHDVGINVHNQDYPSFENRVCLHLAAGHLVLSEGLSPAHGLEPGLDFLEITGPGSLWHIVETLGRFPGVWHGVRVRGRRKAEQFRASRVWPRLLHDALADVAAFGSAR